MRKLRVRAAGERGNVGVLMALFLMVAVGSLTMTWNSVQLSKEKMRLQTAADAAALSCCVWQARGMNAVQNINDDMYILLSISIKLLKVATPIQKAACLLYELRLVPFIGRVCWALADAAFAIALTLGGTAAWMKAICYFILSPLGWFYADFSCALGIWGAQQLAAENGASRLRTKGTSSSETLGDYGSFAVGSAYPEADLLFLPLKTEKVMKTVETVISLRKETRDVPAEPWTFTGTTCEGTPESLKEAAKRLGDSLLDIWTGPVPSWVRRLHTYLGTGRGWSFEPYVSLKYIDGDKKEKARLPSPVIFIARRDSKYIETIDMKWWDKTFSSRPAATTPMLAVAAAQCITGDVIPNSKPAEEGKTNNRPAGFGTGATAKLVPISEYAKLRGEVSGVTGGIFH